MTGSTPSSSAALVRPSKPSWLNDLSSKPPASETMQGRKSRPRRSPPSIGFLGRDPQPASSAAAPSMARPPSAAFLVVTFTVSSKDCAPTVAGPVESRYRMLRSALGRSRPWNAMVMKTRHSAHMSSAGPRARAPKGRAQRAGRSGGAPRRLRSTQLARDDRLPQALDLAVELGRHERREVVVRRDLDAAVLERADVRLVRERAVDAPRRRSRPSRPACSSARS